MALGVTAVFAQSDGDDAVPEDENTLPEESQGQRESRGRRGMFGRFDRPEGLTAKDELLAEALGIDVETLNTARGAARVAAIEQALAEELITEEQAQLLLESENGLRQRHGPRGLKGSVDHRALLAEALDISVEELEAAEQEVHEAALAEMVEAGYLTAEEAQLMAARQALKEAIDRGALLAEVLDISATEVEEALADREGMAALIEESGLTEDEFRAAMQTAYEAAVEQAVEDGVITTEQYEALQEAGLDALECRGRGQGRGGHSHGGPRGYGSIGGDGAARSFGNAPASAPVSANSI
jgi:hypothetical protein